MVDDALFSTVFENVRDLKKIPTVFHLENTPSWQVQQSQNCDHITFQPGTTASTESSDRQRYERFCSGTAPDLTIMRQKI